MGDPHATCSGILLGRTTYEMFAPAWSGRTADDDPGAPFFNESPKHVVSSTLTEPTWGPVDVLDGYDAGALRQLKKSSDGDPALTTTLTGARAFDNGVVHLTYGPAGG